MIKEFLSTITGTGNESIAVTSSEIIEKYTGDPGFPFLISFPRTGSHWLRMIMELYFERPILIRAFYYQNNTNYLALHAHDLDLDIERKNVIYLYRDPIPTIYSQMVFEKDGLEDSERVKYWVDLYRSHLMKWLVEDSYSEKKTIIKYERLRDNLVDEFSNVVSHFSCKVDKDKILESARRVTKSEVDNKTKHDQRVIKTGESYENNRKIFFQEYSDMIQESIFGRHIELRPWFD